MAKNNALGKIRGRFFIDFAHILRGEAYQSLKIEPLLFKIPLFVAFKNPAKKHKTLSEGGGCDHFRGSKARGYDF